MRSRTLLTLLFGVAGQKLEAIEKADVYERKQFMWSKVSILNGLILDLLFPVIKSQNPHLGAYSVHLDF